MTVFPQCLRCKHLHRDVKSWTCDAFPDGEGIPEAILDDEHDHTQPFKGDHGVRFEAIGEPKTSQPAGTVY